jgi:hypothetical protein
LRARIEGPRHRALGVEDSTGQTADRRVGIILDVLCDEPTIGQVHVIVQEEDDLAGGGGQTSIHRRHDARRSMAQIYDAISDAREIRLGIGRVELRLVNNDDLVV